MPELPEMETYKRLLSERVIGKNITAVEVTREKTVNVPVDQFIKEVQGCSITAIERRAKFLVFKLNSGKRLLVHLMLGGVMYVASEDDDIDRTKQVTLSFGGTRLFFIGLRLGYLHLLTDGQLEETFEDLGPEPTDPSFTVNRFLSLMEKKRGALKTTLVNQKFLAGIGNLYSDEICFHAKLLPKRQSNDLSEQEKTTLYNSIQTVLARGIQLGGYMDVPVYKGDQLTGSYNHHCFVYDLEGQPCQRCGQPIIKDEISSRKTFYCNGCQK
ncbi:bifunctional DNA-formamidopyrimidine glycosylase/DNA-(apurinic or apyrimidinic site) lyase [Alkalihalobacillus sp. MEB130]|uniref:bifunctional DNA-formamidopyrimidine glycosylase/DNA-(apurinic or apyrimidinic site) lyase n=1 Tax=Alkalihalobacillus sp. MEB130 TaxID=2976704 RepID=UPI0028DF9860|nr:bifunctional DNA-formamidopyrimidine glycosylase/DNA-(apurinic or apyrimidinic site) lyase [Alkalihalobacillus sp. MEB130]MDT8860876.1 bifunctional DNA-formamidopyrimidine glycosylase/DNA-(apurinic or apyrimidinic site) lyase [Alkalihalobacillus sp. MEB130]